MTDAPRFLAFDEPCKAVPCPDCGARVGRPCKRPSGHVASDLHKARRKESDRLWLINDLPTITRRPDGTYAYDGPETRPSVTHPEERRDLMNAMGVKEQQLKELREKGRLCNEVEDLVIPPFLKRTGDGPQPKKADEKSAGVSLAPPLAVQKAIAADLADDEKTKPTATAPAQQQETTMKKTTKKASSKKTSSKAKAAPKAKAPAKKATAKKPAAKVDPKPETTKTPAPGARPDGLRPDSKQAVMLDLALAEGGATEKAICEKLGWKKCRVTLKRVADKVGATLTQSKNAAGETVWQATMPKAA